MSDPTPRGPGSCTCGEHPLDDYPACLWNSWPAMGAATVYTSKEDRMRDMKEALGSARKADITHFRSGIKIYGSRGCEYGSAKYERGNYLRPVGAEGDLRADFERFRSYLRATASHLDATLDAMELHQAGDPNLEDQEGMLRAAYAADTDSKPGCPVGPSFLPHVAHAAASLMMAIEQARTYGLLPMDPGRPWERDRSCEFTESELSWFSGVEVP